MKIITWNCNGRFRDKYKKIRELDADIYIIQECENPEEYTDTGYKKFASNYLWTGDLKYKGLGIFAKDNIKLELLPYNDNAKHFIPCRVDNLFNLLGVWTMSPYVEQAHDFYESNKELFNEYLVMCGDFNSSVVFDNRHKKKSFAMLLNKYQKHRLYDSYHYLTKEKQGKETKSTFYLARHLNKNYHLDHVFTAPFLIKDLEILDHYKWINESDHLPIVFEIDEDVLIDEKLIEFTEKELSKKETTVVEKEIIEKPLKKEDIKNKLLSLDINQLERIAKFHNIKPYGNKYVRVDNLLGKLPLRILNQNVEALKSGEDLEKYVPKQHKLPEPPSYPTRKRHETDDEYRYRTRS